MKSKTLKNLVALTVVSAVSIGSLMAGEMKEHAMMHDGVMMKHGKMMVMKDGQNMTMTEDITRSDGTRVMKVGRGKVKAGQTMTGKNG